MKAHESAEDLKRAIANADITLDELQQHHAALQANLLIIGQQIYEKCGDTTPQESISFACEADHCALTDTATEIAEYQAIE